jgi:acyl-CoA synthetase (AMP-forming)/AMP-acid ligase II/1-acyl-sn-glycerol-3-phosphate acyltransferase
VKIHWLDDFLRDSKTKVLLPTHVALIDPLIMMAYVGSKVSLRPVIQASFRQNRLLEKLFRFVRPIWIHNSASEEWVSTEWPKKIEKNIYKEAVHEIYGALMHHENVMLYPAGVLKTDASESIVGKKAAYDIVSMTHQDTSIYAVRIRWLWGSYTSRAWNGKSNSLLLFFLRWVRFWLVNLLFFVPKRAVTIYIENITHEAKEKPHDGVDSFNSRLQDRYNQAPTDTLAYIPYYWFYNNVATKKLPQIIHGSYAHLKKTTDYSTILLDEHMFDRVVSHIHTMKPAIEKEIVANTHVIFDLYFDSLDTAELKSFVQETFPWATNPPLADLKVVGDYVIMAMGKSPHIENLKPCEWHYPDTDKTLREIVDSFSDTDTIPTLFKKVFWRHQSYSFCYDHVFGVQSRKDYVIKAYLISDLLKQYEGEYIGIMLPALTGTSLMITAAYLAKKTPVMLNRTQWELAFDHCATYKKVPAILTSRKFYTKIEAPHYEKYNLVFLEDLLKHVSLKQKLVAVWKSLLFRIPSQNTEAVILFTSWSEAMPKAVPLTHQNIIQNIKWALQLLDVEKDDIILGFLPPFHSFGFTVNTILPLITWLRVVYSPDPNDSKTLANVVEHTKVTWVASTPTFIRKVLAAAKGEQLRSLKFIITWAEKCPAWVFELLHELVPTATIIEWYGITECSPVIAANPVEHPKPWTVWLPIKWLTIKILDIETNKEASAWQEGMIFVSWPSVFHGYINSSIESPFLDIAWQRYYKTGDLWYLDHDWYLTITWRLKRFVKIAWEMVSLPFIEGILLEKYGKSEDLTMAVEWIETPNWWAMIVVFFTTPPPSVEEINAYLRQQWASTFIRVDETRQINIIPVLWTGKVDYKILKAQIHNFI